jgi:hypothetical protein
MKTESKQSFPLGEGKSDEKCYLFRSGDGVEKLGAVVLGLKTHKIAKAATRTPSQHKTERV